jgi:putative inorganic carbon (HCO3(-)) transporter
VPVGGRTLLAWQWPFANKNTLGYLGALGVPAAAALALDARGGARAGWTAVLLVDLVGLGMSYARTGWIAAAVGLVVLILGLARGRARVGLLAALAAAAALVVVKTGATRLDALWGHGLSGRGGLWAAALAVFRQHPLLGVGPGNAPTALAPYVSAAYRGLTPHDGALETLVELGLPGLVLAGGAVVAALVRAIRVRGGTPLFWVWLALLLAALTEQVAESAFFGGVSFEDYLLSALVASVVGWERGRGLGFQRGGGVF